MGISKGKNCLMLFQSLFLLIICIKFAKCAIIVTTQPVLTSTSADGYSSLSKCYGNFVLVNARCVPCQRNQIAQANRCVELLGWGYGANLQKPLIEKQRQTQNYNNNQNSNKGSAQEVKQKIVQNCVKASTSNDTFCVQCLTFYDLIEGKCVEQSCKIYSQVVGKCLDDLKPAQIQNLTFISQNIGKTKNTAAPSQQIYIIGGQMSKMEVVLIDDIVSLTLPNVPIRIPEKNILFNRTQNYIPNNATIIQISKQTSSIRGCVRYHVESQRCLKCQQGQILNVLANQCRVIAPAIVFLPQK